MHPQKGVRADDVMLKYKSMLPDPRSTPDDDWPVGGGGGGGWGGDGDGNGVPGVGDPEGPLSIG